MSDDDLPPMSDRVRARVEASEGRAYYWRAGRCWRVVPHMVPDRDRRKPRHCHDAIDDSILQAIGRSGAVRSEIISHVLSDYGSVTTRTIERRLVALRESGRIVHVGTRGAGRYERAKKAR